MKLDRFVEEAGAWIVAALVILLCVVSLAGCGAVLRAEGCYLDPEYGEICVVAERSAAGVVSVSLKTNVKLPDELRARVLKWGGKLLDQESAPD